MTGGPMTHDARGPGGAGASGSASGGASPSSRRRASRIPAVLFALALAAVGYGLGRDASSSQHALRDSETLADTPTVLAAVQQLARLETVTYHMERVIDLRDRQSRFFGLVKANDALLLIAAGDVVAGVDLAQLGRDDIQTDPVAGRVVLRLPPAQVFSARLDNQHTYVHSRSTDLLAERDEHFETRARQVAESEIRKAALSTGILDEAQQGADRTLRSLLQALGFRDVQLAPRE